MGAGAHIIDGKAFAAGLRARIAEAVPAFRAATGRAPGLAVVLVGDDPASAVYVGSKGKATVAAGMESFEHRLPADATQEEVERCSPRSTPTTRSTASCSSFRCPAISTSSARWRRSIPTRMSTG